MAKGSKSDTKQTNILVGAALVILGAIFIAFAVYQPTESSNNNSINSNESYVQNAYNDANYENDGGYVNDDSVRDTSYPLNLNTCTAEELMTINGIGETRALSIIAYRDVIGGYSDIEQLKNISGIGDAFIEKVAPYVTV